MNYVRRAVGRRSQIAATKERPVRIRAMRQDGVFKVPDGSVGLLARIVEVCCRRLGGCCVTSSRGLCRRANRILSGNPAAVFGPCFPLEGGTRQRRALAPMIRRSFRTVPREHEGALPPAHPSCRQRAPLSRWSVRIPCNHSLVFSFRSRVMLARLTLKSRAIEKTRHFFTYMLTLDRKSHDSGRPHAPWNPHPAGA